MLAFLRLIRFPNLFIIAATQCIIRICLIEPILNLSGFELQMSNLEFFLMALATVFIAAGGYIINDYFDVHIDHINKPDELVIDKGVKRRVAMAAHAVLSSIGVAIGVFISWRANLLLSGGVLFTLAVIALWFYSTSFKYQFITGNIIISLLAAMIPLMVILFEIPRVIAKYNSQLLQQQHDLHTTVTHTVLLWVGAYTAAAFLLSLIREIIKDMEDVEGDKEYGCQTIPLVLGIKKAKMIAIGLIASGVAGIGYVQVIQRSYNDKFFFLYFLLALQAPLLFLAFRLVLAKEKKDFHFASVLVKLIMLAGISYLLVFRFILLR